MRVVVASESALEREQLRQAAQGVGLDCAATDCVTPDALAARLADVGYGLAILGVGLNTPAGLAAIHGVESRTKTPVCVVWDPDAAVDLPALLRAGASAYIRRTDMQTDLLGVVQQLRSDGDIKVAWGQVIAVTGGLPGVGVTTVATNLAFALAEKYPGRVALAQLTDGIPDLALNLDVSPAYPLAELAEGWYRLDGGLMRRCMVDHPAGVSVLADQVDRRDAVQWQPAAMRQLLVLLRSRFDFVIADLGHALDNARREAIRMADAVAVVARLDVPAVRVTRDWLTRLREMGVAYDRLLGVVNRTGQKEQLSWKTAREALPMTLGESIPDDPARTNHALNTGRPLVQSARNAAITAGFARLADRWQDTVKTGGIVRRMLAGVG
jgi:pilus assembly protein CpaE